MNIKRSLLAIGLVFSAASANASTITDVFSFSNSSSTVIASGSFSYASSATGIIGYSQLSSFSISVFGQSYDLSFVQGLLGDPNNYVYFGYDVASHEFVPAAVTGYDIPFSGILAASTGYKGFFISPLHDQADPAGTVSDGQVSAYDPFTSDFAVKLSQVSSIPEPSTWAMFLVGFLGLGWMTYRRRQAAASLINFVR